MIPLLQYKMCDDLLLNISMHLQGKSVIGVLIVQKAEAAVVYYTRGRGATYVNTLVCRA